VSRILTTRMTNLLDHPVQHKMLRLKIGMAPASLAPSTAPTRSVLKSNADLQTMLKAMKSKARAMSAAELIVPRAGKAKSKLNKTSITMTGKQLHEALMYYNANPQSMLETLMDTQEALDAKLTRRKKPALRNPRSHITMLCHANGIWES
jgi:hypothetical protein